MTRGFRWWAVVLVMQVAYGLAIFLGTRAYYFSESSAPLTSGSVTRGLPSYFPEPGTTLRPFSLEPVRDDPGSLMDQANSVFQSKDYVSAARLYARVLELAPGNAVIYNNLGLTLFYLNRTDEALAKLTQGVAIDPQMQRIWLTLGFVQSNIGNLTEARQALQKVIELGTNNEIGQEARRMIEQLPQ